MAKLPKAFQEDAAPAAPDAIPQNLLHGNTIKNLYIGITAEEAQELTAIDVLLGAVDTALPGPIGAGIPFPESEWSKYVITSVFGYREDATPGPHHGFDISGSGDKRIISPFAGLVVSHGEQHGYGNVLAIKPDGLLFKGEQVYLFFAHLAGWEAGTEVGKRVSAGQHIATMGNSTGGRAAVGIHLHYETRVGSNDKEHSWRPDLVLPGLDTLKRNPGPSKVTPYDKASEIAPPATSGMAPGAI